MPAAAANSNDRVPRYPPGTPGASTINLSLKDLDGVWTLSFGRFGWKDYETRGAIIRIENGRMFGGGSNFVYRGAATIVGDNAVQVACIVDAITPDHFEGRLNDDTRVSKDVLPEVRLALVRSGPL